jgi:hypothetical protein
LNIGKGMQTDNKNYGLRGDYAEKWAHHSVGYLIASTKDYIVYLDQDGYIDWETTPDYDAELGSSPAYKLEMRNLILSESALLEVSPCEGLTDVMQRHFKRLIGEALVCSLEFDYSGAQKMIGAARQFIRARSEETSRDWYLSASFLASGPFALVGVLAWLLREQLTSAIGLDGLWLLLATVAGALGALLSVITRAGRLKCDSSAGKRLHFLEGQSRIAAGAISGLLVALAVRSEIILASLTREHQLHVIMILGALAAGAGERLAPSIISKFDATTVKGDASGQDSDKQEVRIK